MQKRAKDYLCHAVAVNGRIKASKANTRHNFI